MQPFTLAPASETAAVGVLAQSASSCAAELLTIRAWATRYGLEVVDLGTSAEPDGGDAGCQLVIALGGDGAVLRALQVAMAQHAAVLGVNFGHVGFLADIRGDELSEALERVASGQALLDERSAGGADRGGARTPVHRVQRRRDRAAARLRLARLSVVVAGGSLLVLEGDGVVIASRPARRPTRSGPAARRWRRPSMPSSSRRGRAGRALRSLVVDGSEVVRVELEPDSAPLSIEIDGPETHALPRPTRSRSAGGAQGAARAHAPAHLLSRPRYPAVA